MDKFGLAGIGVIAIAMINAAALFNGIDGVVMTTCVATIAALIAGTVGFSAGKEGR